MLRKRLGLLLAGSFLMASAAWADDQGFIDCASHPDDTKVFGKARQSQDVVGSVSCGERFTVLVYGFVFSRVQTKDGKIGFIFSNLISVDHGGKTALQPASERVAVPRSPSATKSSAAFDGVQTGPASATPATTPAPQPVPVAAQPVRASAASAAPAPAPGVASPASASPATPSVQAPATIAGSPATAASVGPPSAASAPAAASSATEITLSTAPPSPAAPAKPEPVATQPQPVPASAAPAPPAPATPEPAAQPTPPPSEPPAAPATTSPAASSATGPQPSAPDPAASPVREANVRSTWEQPIPGARKTSLVELYGGYSLSRFDSGGATYSSYSNLNGAMGAFAVNVKPWLQITGDSSYNFITVGTAKSVLYGNHFGPRVYVRKLSRWGATPFAEALVGGSRLDVTVSGTGGYKTSANCISYKAGGGIDFHPTRRFEIRLIDVDYYRTAFGTNLHQNNYSASAGIIVRLFGGSGRVD